MSSIPVRWIVSPVIDASLREFLTAEGPASEDELSRFAEALAWARQQ